MKINPNYIRVLDSSNESKIAYTRNDPSNKSKNYKLFKNTVIFMLEKKIYHELSVIRESIV